MRVLLLLLSLAVLPARAEMVVPLTVGGTEIQVAVDDGYVQTSTKLPSLHEVTAAALGPTTRLVDSFVTDADAKRTLAGMPLGEPFLQVQVLRNAEAFDLSTDDWTVLVPQVAKSLTAIDTNAALHATESMASDRMTTAAGTPIKMQFGEVGKPAIYRQDQSGLRFTLLAPVTMQGNGQTLPFTLECGAAIVRLRGKMVYLLAYRRHAEGEDAGKVRALLDHFADRALALNPADPPATAPPPPAPPAHG